MDKYETGLFVLVFGDELYTMHTTYHYINMLRICLWGILLHTLIAVIVPDLYICNEWTEFKIDFVRIFLKSVYQLHIPCLQFTCVQFQNIT